MVTPLASFRKYTTGMILPESDPLESIPVSSQFAPKRLLPSENRHFPGYQHPKPRCCKLASLEIQHKSLVSKVRQYQTKMELMAYYAYKVTPRTPRR